MQGFFDFMFLLDHSKLIQLGPEEWAVLRSQIATLEAGRGGHRKLPIKCFASHDP
jgi:hypothetical protein